MEVLADAYDARKPVGRGKVIVTIGRVATNEVPDHRFQVRYFSIGKCRWALRSGLLIRSRCSRLHPRLPSHRFKIRRSSAERDAEPSRGKTRLGDKGATRPGSPILSRTLWRWSLQAFL
jgi:hypothetical protein